ncbi:MAG: carboxypeptidase-like regulatory domain-containing protein [Flavobacteriaceae bacterium]|nr:carboxypeptidase-like regulatory domain-containing protein [Flavobacteriaceae bacterium]
MKIAFLLFSTLFLHTSLNAQQSVVVKGHILDHLSNNPVQRVQLFLGETKFLTQSDLNGTFHFFLSSNKEQLITFSHTDYETKNITLDSNSIQDTLSLGIILLYPSTNNDLSNIISADELANINDENGESNVVTGMLSSGRDLFNRTVSFEFGAAFFKPRNVNAHYNEIALNGIPMNKFRDGRANWSNWGGLNDATRYQMISNNTELSSFSFGDLGSSVNISTRPMDYSKGFKLSYAYSNRAYTNRIMLTYGSGLTKNKWSFLLSASHRSAESGYKEGTPYFANSFLASAEKILSPRQSLQMTAITAQNYRGKTSSVTKEVFALKDNKYNTYWGSWDNDTRNARTQTVFEPLIILNHYWTPKPGTQVQTNFAGQFGTVGNTRIDYGGSSLISDSAGNEFLVGGGTNPDPSYYQKLPSYFLRDPENPDYTNAYLAEQDFLKNGQINWNDLYQANINNKNNGLLSTYALYEDKTDDRSFWVNSVINHKISERLKLNAALGYKNLMSENYAEMSDLLGGEGYLDVYNFSEDIIEAQNDLRNPNKIVKNEDRFKYNYKVIASIMNGFAQIQYQRRKIEAYASLQFDRTSYQRNGLYENGRYPGEKSFGKSEVLDFMNYGAKIGFIYKITGRHLISSNAFYATKAPSIQNSFSNIRETNETVIDLKSEGNLSADLNYYFRHPKINAKISGYFIQQQDRTSISFYYADGLMNISENQTTAFVQEVLTGISSQNTGMEIALEIPVLNDFKLTAVAAAGQAVYTNNPNLYLTSDDFIDAASFGQSYLKNYHLSGGPQQAYSAGFAYNSPRYFWFNMTANYFDNSFVQVAPLLRTSNFLMDTDGLPINDLDADLAKKMLEQEKIEPFFLVNVSMGKSWKFKDHYFGGFLSVANINNTIYKTGGYEQSRNANYNTLLEDKKRQMPLFGPKYWYGTGTNYFVSVYWRI